MVLRFHPLALLAVLTISIVAAPADAAPVLWNKLGSATEVQNSAFGPNLTFYVGGVFPDVPGTPAYVPGVFGNAVTLTGSYGTFDREHNVIWNTVNQFVNADRGTIEAWFKQNSNPVANVNGVYRIFDGAYGLGPGVGLWSDAANNALNFDVGFGGTDVGVQTNISPLNGTWIHLAGVWDRNGIGASADKVRLYVNGSVVAASTAAGWGNTVGQYADIAGGNDGSIAGKFAVDNLKVFNTALTDFSDRFDESALPEPAGLALIVAGLVPVLSRRGPRRFPHDR
jgi:Concanavalin A-like lectin/glucanases superfamily